MYTIVHRGMAGEEVDLVEISAEPISQQKVVEFVTDPSAGGIAVFIGQSIHLCSVELFLTCLLPQ